MKPRNHTDFDDRKLNSAVNRALDLLDGEPESRAKLNELPNSASRDPQIRLSGNFLHVFLEMGPAIQQINHLRNNA